MRNIIQQILSETAEKYVNCIKKNGIMEISRMSEEFKSISIEMSKEILAAVIAAADDAICEAKAERKADGIKIHERKVPREIYTSLGMLEYERTYFNKPIGRSYILDSILGVEAYERIDAGVSAKLVNLAATHSYGKSAELAAGGQISRQSVRNKLMNTGEVAYVPERIKETPEILHIFADEDHVHLQSGKNTIVPLVTVCGGKAAVCEGRNRLTDPFYVQGYAMKPEDYWEYIYALCAERYDMRRVKKIYVYGDGAAWIIKFKDVFTDALHVIDEFHFKKRMKALFTGEICSQYGLAASNAITGGNKALFDGTIQRMLNAVEDQMPEGREKTGRISTIKENAAYIIKFWDAVQNAKLPDTIGSCTEAMVSHILSARLSRNPMGWSKEGLSKMAMVRVFVLNGCEVEPADTLVWKRNPDKCSVITSIEKYEAIVKKQQEEILKDAKHWRWFEVDDLISGKTTGTSVALDALGRTRNIA